MSRPVLAVACPQPVAFVAESTSLRVRVQIAHRSQTIKVKSKLEKKVCNNNLKKQVALRTKQVALG